MTASPTGLGSLDRCSIARAAARQGRLRARGDLQPRGARDPAARSRRRRRTVAGGVVGEVRMRATPRRAALGSVGVVIGATVDLADYGIDRADCSLGTPILAPGFGHQGAPIADVPALFGRSRAECAS